MKTRPLFPGDLCVRIFLCWFSSILLLAAQPISFSDPAAQDAAEAAKKKWLPVFEQVGNEFGVPADILAGVAFNQTHWEHVVWPPGEPDGHYMPRQYGIMGLWENDSFGHQLTDAARLIGQPPDNLRNDPLQNIRGAAALLKKIYSETPLPENTNPGDLASWRNALAKFSGFPERDLSQSFALGAYQQIAKGYDDYGWAPHAIDLQPISDAVAKVALEEKAKREARESEEQNSPSPSPAPLSSGNQTRKPAFAEKLDSVMHKKAISPPQSTAAITPEANSLRPWLIGVAVIFGFIVVRLFRSRSRH